MSTFFFFIFLPIVFVLGFILWLSESREQKVRRMVQSGISQRECARKLNVSRYYVSKVLKAA